MGQGFGAACFVNEALRSFAQCLGRLLSCFRAESSIGSRDCDPQSLK